MTLTDQDLAIVRKVARKPRDERREAVSNWITLRDNSPEPSRKARYAAMLTALAAIIESDNNAAASDRPVFAHGTGKTDWD